jgi:2-amino-4-hydroxy-6-hydroxymethyldihydropteridine diphosphokinase
MNRDGEFAGTRSVPVAIGIGSNLGARLKHLDFARDHLGGLLVDSRFSRIYESEPMHVREQPAFLNACCVGRTRLAAPDLLERLQRLERTRGRTKTGRRYGPRPLDLDILLYGDLVIDSPGLRVPHPRLPERAFVLVPLAELAPEWVHPERGQTVGELAAGVSSTGVSMHQPSTVDQPAWSEREDDA